MKLSERIRAGSEAAPWVVEEVRIIEAKLASLQPQAEALHKVAAAPGFEAGVDVTMAPAAARNLAASFNRLDQAHQDMTAERDDWRNYAREAGAQKVRTQVELNQATDKLEAAAQHIAELEKQRDDLQSDIATLDQEARQMRARMERLERESSACDMVAELTKQRDELLDLLALALPYIEDAESDPAYKPGAVAKMTRRIRDAVISMDATACAPVESEGGEA